MKDIIIALGLFFGTLFVIVFIGLVIGAIAGAVTKNQDPCTEKYTRFLTFAEMKRCEEIYNQK
jgi:hypothetical protein